MRKLSLTFLSIVAAVELGSVGCAKNESRDTTPASQSGAQTNPNGVGGGPRMQPGMGTDSSGTGNGPNSRTPTDSRGPSGASGTGPSQPGQPSGGSGTAPSGPK